MERGEKHGRLILQLACNTLVFTREFIQSCSKNLESIEPEYVICENPNGVFKDFGNGFYAYRKQSKDEQTLVLKCTVGSVTFQVNCPIGSDKVLSVPEHLDLPCSDMSELTLRRQASSLSGYTVLSDGTVMIPIESLCRHAFGKSSDKVKVSFLGVDDIERGYTFNVTPLYLLVYPNQTLLAPKSKLCHLSLLFKNFGSDEVTKVMSCLDFSRFSSLFTSRLSLSLDTKCFEQKALTQVTPSLSSPITFVESVFCLDGQQFLVPQADGSFVDKEEKGASNNPRRFVYSICDGVEHVATGIAVANLPRLLQVTTKRRQTNAEY
jgi:hypothetical protein